MNNTTVVVPRRLSQALLDIADNSGMRTLADEVSIDLEDLDDILCTEEKRVAPYVLRKLEYALLYHRLGTTDIERGWKKLVTEMRVSPAALAGFGIDPKVLSKSLKKHVNFTRRNRAKVRSFMVHTLTQPEPEKKETMNEKAKTAAAKLLSYGDFDKDHRWFGTLSRVADGSEPGTSVLLEFCNKRIDQPGDSANKTLCRKLVRKYGKKAAEDAGMPSGWWVAYHAVNRGVEPTQDGVEKVRAAWEAMEAGIAVDQGPSDARRLASALLDAHGGDMPENRMARRMRDIAAGRKKATDGDERYCRARIEQAGDTPEMRAARAFLRSFTKEAARKAGLRQVYDAARNLALGEGSVPPNHIEEMLKVMQINQSEPKAAEMPADDATQDDDLAQLEKKLVLAQKNRDAARALLDEAEKDVAAASAELHACKERLTQRRAQQAKAIRQAADEAIRRVQEAAEEAIRALQGGT
jgi:hypothetical protein